MPISKNFTEPAAGHKNRVHNKVDDAVLFNGGITLFLIAFISTAFTFFGTGSHIASLLGGIAAISCLLLALVSFWVYIKHLKHRH